MSNLPSRFFSYAAIALVASSVLGCAKPQLNAHVEILAGARFTSSGMPWSIEVSLLRGAINQAVQPGRRIVLSAITARSASDLLLDATLPSESAFGRNGRDVRHDVYRARQEALNLINRLATLRPVADKTEIIAAIQESVRRFNSEPPGVEKILVIDASGWEQSGLLNMGDVRLKLYEPNTVHGLILHLIHLRAVPSLKGVRVCMTQPSAGISSQIDSPQQLGAARFWKAFFQATGAASFDDSENINICLHRTR